MRDDNDGDDDDIDHDVDDEEDDEEDEGQAAAAGHGDAFVSMHLDRNLDGKAKRAARLASSSTTR